MAGLRADWGSTRALAVGLALVAGVLLLWKGDEETALLLAAGSTVGLAGTVRSARVAALLHANGHALRGTTATTTRVRVGVATLTFGSGEEKLSLVLLLGLLLSIFSESCGHKG